MAVLLEGINIPEGNPITINIYRDGTWVNAYTTEDGNAIEVPEPHGRLGDLDKLNEEMHLLIKENMLSRDDARDLLETIADAPTIIPASEEG